MISDNHCGVYYEINLRIIIVLETFVTIALYKSTFTITYHQHEIGNESVPKTMIHDTLKLFFFLKLQAAFWQF